MYAKKVKRKCGVRGCKNINSFHISLTREIGNSVIICKSCLEKGLKTVDDIKPIPDARVHYSEAPPLFFNDVKKTNTEVAEVPTQEEKPAEETVPTQEERLAEETIVLQTEPSTDTDVDTPPQDASEFVCPHCGQVCKTELGLQKHIAAKHKDLA